MFVLENLRLRDLVAIVRQNQAFHDEFVRFLSGHGHRDVHAFVKEAEDANADGGLILNCASPCSHREDCCVVSD